MKTLDATLSPEIRNAAHLVKLTELRSLIAAAVAVLIVAYGEANAITLTQAGLGRTVWLKRAAA